MRTIILSALLGLSSLCFITPDAQASWLSDLLKGNRREPGPYYGQYVPQNGYYNGGYPIIPGGYYQPGPYAPMPPSVQAWVPNISGTWFMGGNPYAPCQIIQGANGGAEFINERGERSWGRVFTDRVWAADWSDGRSNGLRGWLRGNQIAWSNGTFWSR